MNGRKRIGPDKDSENRDLKGDSGNGSPRRWGWGIPLKKTIRHPNLLELSPKTLFSSIHF
jgi:hypothetical protein